jgi:hypothetical protein
MIHQIEPLEASLPSQGKKMVGNCCWEWWHKEVQLVDMEIVVVVDMWEKAQHNSDNNTLI